MADGDTRPAASANGAADGPSVEHVRPAAPDAPVVADPVAYRFPAKLAGLVLVPGAIAVVRLMSEPSSGMMLVVIAIGALVTYAAALWLFDVKVLRLEQDGFVYRYPFRPRPVTLLWSDVADVALVRRNRRNPYGCLRFTLNAAAGARTFSIQASLLPVPVDEVARQISMRWRPSADVRTEGAPPAGDDRTG
jgi:hypothetical protein